MSSTPIRGLTPRGGGRRGGRGGRRPRAPKILNQTPSSVSQQNLGASNLAMLAQAINHQQEIDAASVQTTSTTTTVSTTPATPSEPPQVAITPKKVVVVPTPSGEVLRTTSVTSTASTCSEEKPAIGKHIFPPGLTFLASVFWTFLTYFSDPAFPGILREEVRSPYLIKKKLTRRGIKPGSPE